MSTEKNIREAHRWLKTAESDLEVAVILLDKHRYSHSCFHSQQAAEKAMKAVWYMLDADPWGHSIKRLVQELEHVDSQTMRHFEPVTKAAVLLDRFYIPTRYPNGLPDLTPEEAFLMKG